MTRPITSSRGTAPASRSLNTYPYTGGHLLIVPYQQAPDLNGLTDEELADLLKLTRRCQNALTS